jgi:hypothetical protein
VGEKWVSDDYSYLCKGLKSTTPIGQKLDFANHSYLCKGLYKVVLDNINDNGYHLHYFVKTNKGG